MSKRARAPSRRPGASRKDRGRAGALADLAAAIRHLTGRPARAEERERFEKYLDLLLLWSRTHRLTGLETDRDIVHKLFIDSLLFLPLLPPRPLRVVDIGSGSGIPGVPLKIVEPALGLTLIESRRKAVSFLAALKRALGLEGVTVFHGRAEAMLLEEPESKGQYDVVVMRGLGVGPALLDDLREYLRPGGLIIISGPPKARAAAVASPGSRLAYVPYPPLGLERTFIIHDG